MISISLCMIVKNEEKVLKRCLNNVMNLVDEVIIVDTGSTDRTKEVAKQFTDKIFDFPWENDFSKARNFSLSKATKDYFMWLDADDVFPDEKKNAFLEMKKSLDPAIDMITMPYETDFDEKGRPIFSYIRERICRNHGGFHFQGKVHEAIPFSGKIWHLDIPIRHKKEKPKERGRNLKIYLDMEKRGEFFDSRSLYYFGRELLAGEQYARAGEVFQKFLERPDGWIENQIDAQRQLAFCFRKAGKEKEALNSLLNTMSYDVPRGEVCCELGEYFLEQKKYEQAVYWYRQALHAPKRLETGAFIQEECYGFLPAIFLCVCYDRMGDFRKAEYYNDLAGKFKPDSIHYQRNKIYFEDRRKQHAPIS